MHAQLGKILDKRYKPKKKKKKPKCHFWRAWSKSRVLRVPPAHHHLRVGKWPKHHLQPHPWTHPYLHPIWGTSLPPQRMSEQGNPCLFLLPTAAEGTPIKPCLNFLSGFWSISIDRRRSRTLVDTNLVFWKDCLSQPSGEEVIFSLYFPPLIIIKYHLFFKLFLEF